MNYKDETKNIWPFFEINLKHKSVDFFTDVQITEKRAVLRGFNQEIQECQTRFFFMILKKKKRCMRKRGAMGNISFDEIFTYQIDSVIDV